jgi:hypothetical protein
MEPISAIETSRELVVPVGWLIAIIGTLGGVVATLAGIIWHTLKERLAVQDKIIEKLQDDVDRLSKGCGHTACIWKAR